MTNSIQSKSPYPYFVSLAYNKKLAIFLWFGLSFIAALGAILNNEFNNFIIFRQSFFHLVSHLNLYQAYPPVDRFYYSPSFAAFMAIFALFPEKLGVFFWVALNTFSLYYAINRLPIAEKNKNFILILSSNEMMNANSNVQSNGLMAACIIMSFVFAVENRERLSTLISSSGFFIKLYGLAGLAFFPFVKNKKTFVGYFVLWMLILFLIPMLFFSYTYIVDCYDDWYKSLAIKSNFDITIDMYKNGVDISVMGMIKRIFNLPRLSKWIVILPALLTFCLQYLPFRYWKNYSFQLLILCSTLIFTVIFNTGAESPTYIIAVPAICLWFTLHKKDAFTTVFFWICMFFSSFGFSDLFTPWLRTHILAPFALKSLGAFLVWLIIAYELLSGKFLHLLQIEEDKSLNSSLL